MGARRPVTDTVAANIFLARQLAAGCNRYAELLVESAEAASKHNVSGPLEVAYDEVPPDAVFRAGAMDLESTRELAALFRQHAAELLAAHRVETGG